ncbi:hypothetical protein FC96_GL002386 [Secundilactobacillus kimchicus JCM 15530]|uniref:Uncharacterized protein n=1 Tax=Secundilactobacillus kimchicus JCM 15530 TaxID=1302272 RepID=A0A0R1HLM0_9LACO|nr:hypothetical protein FC96_GL002386 [Secundilactobacillus kimchicus JCM 15530]
MLADGAVVEVVVTGVVELDCVVAGVAVVLVVVELGVVVELVVDGVVTAGCVAVAVG